MKKFIIQNAYVIDGSGTPAFPADVLIEDGTIRSIGKQDPQQAGMVIDAHGLTLAPGFINSHSHGDMMADLDDTFFQETEQGVTTLIAGMCQMSNGSCQSIGNRFGIWMVMSMLMSVRCTIHMQMSMLQPQFMRQSVCLFCHIGSLLLFHL